MIADDPFTHEEFRDRLGKLLRLLSSDQEAEAEAARRKLIQHLAHHGVSLSDLTAHLTGHLEGGGEGHVAPASGDALRHAVARAQRAEADHRAAEEMNVRLLQAVARGHRRQLTGWVLAGVLAMTWVAAGLVMLAGRVWTNHDVIPVRQVAPRMSDTIVPRPPPGPVSTAPGAGAAGNTSGGAGARQAGEWAGTVQQPAELLDDPDSAAQRRAMLDTGSRVLVLDAGPVWLRVRSERGDGYVLKGLVRADR